MSVRMTISARWCKRRITEAAVLLIALWTVAAMPLCEAVAQEDPHPALRFQRVFVPEERISDWPRGEGKYLPLDAAEFEELVAAVRPKESVPVASIASARYEARFSNDRLLGLASLDAVLPGHGPAVVSLGSCNLAIAKIVPNDADQASEIVLGQAGDGELQAIVHESGPFQFEWSLAGRRNSPDILSFLLDIPAAPITEFTVDLPEGLVPSTNRGLALGSKAIGDGWLRWRFELGGRKRFRLNLLTVGAVERRPQLALLRESRTCDVSERGIEVSAQWKLQVYNEPLSEITLLLDPGLQLISARCGDVLLPWSNAPPPAGGTGTRVVLTLPEPIRDTEQIIRLSALGGAILNRPWQLPRIRAEGLFWQEGSISLLTSDPLAADRVAPLGCSQTATGLLSPPRVGESMQFQAYDPEATVEVLMSSRPAMLQSRSAVGIELTAEEVHARLATDFQLTRGARYVLEADVAPQWIVENVESAPAGAVVDWSFDGTPGGKPLLTVQLREAISPQKPLRLTIAARKPVSTLQQPLVETDLSPVLFRNTAYGKQTVGIRPASSFATHLKNDDGLKRLRAEDLTPSELEWFSNPPHDLLFENNNECGRLAVSLVPQEAKYRGSIHIEATAVDGMLREKYSLRCVPQSGRVERILVRLASDREGVSRWTIGGNEMRPLSARKISTDNSAATKDGGSLELWELTLAQPRSASFEITAFRETPLPASVALASLPEATTQSGVVTIHAPDGEPLRITPERLRPIPPAPIASDRVQTVRGVFRYDPARDVAAGASASLRIDRDTLPVVAAPGNAWARRCSLISCYQADGTAWHRAAFDLENWGQTSLRIAWPIDENQPEIRGVWIDGEAVAWVDAGPDEPRRIGVRLPVGRKHPRFTMQWTTTEQPLGMIGSVASPLPTCDVPILACDWTAWLPPGYVFDESQGNQVSINDRFDETDMLPGWSKHSMDLSGSRPVLLHVLHLASVRLTAAIVFLVVVGLGCRYTARQKRLYIALTGLLALIGLLLPGPYVPVILGGVFGLFFCLMWRWIQPGVQALRMKFAPEAATVLSHPVARGKEPRKEGSSLMANASSLGSTVTKVVELGLMFVATCFAMDGISPVHAQTIATEESNAAANSAHRVLIPANADKKPSGDKVYVPETFYRALYWAAASVGKPRGWLIRQARYQGDLTAETGQTRFAINSLRAVFDLEVFGRYTQVRIPLEYRHGLLSAEGVSLDGRPAPCQWESDALTLDIAEPGVYRLEIPLHPNITSEIHSMEMGVPEQVEPRFFSPTSGVNLAIPRISRSRLELNLPEPAPMIEVPSAVGAVTHENENKPSRLIAQLGPADRLTIRWQNKDTSDEIAPSVRAESRLWLKIQPGSLVIHAKFAFHVIEGHLQQAQIAVDPRLRLLPLSGDDPPTVHIRQEIEQSRIITFHWSRPIMDRATLETTFLLSGATGVGNFHLPRIELLNVPSVNRSMAVSVDPALDCDEQQTSGLEPITTYEFLKAWTGESDGQSAKWSPLADRPEQTDIAPPQSAYRLPAERIDWSISTRPHETRTVADQTLSVSCDLDHIDFTFEAQLSTASGYLFQHRFAAPKDCVIEAVSLLEGNVERAARWSRDEAGAVTIFLNNAVSGQQKLVARGRIAMPKDRPWNLPDLRLERCEIRSSNLRIFQRPGVQLAIEGGKPINGEKPRRETSAGIDLGHFVASYAREESDSLSVTAKVEESQSDPIARSPAESPDDKSTVKQAAKPHAGGMVQLADISTSWHDGGACFGKAVFHIDPQGSSECPLLLPAGYELIHVSVEGITVTLTETGDNAWRFPLVSPSLPQCVQVLYRTELRRGGRSKRSAMRSPAIADWTVRRTLWSVDGPPAWKACDPAESPSVESWRQEFQRLSSIAAMIETAATDPTNDPAEGPRWFLTWSQRFHASLSALRDELPTAKDVAEAAEAREKAGLIEKRVAGLARRLGLEISKAAPHVSRDVMAGSRAAVYCSMEGRVDALTFDCRGAEREDFSRWFLAAVAMTTLTLLVAQSRRSKLFAGRV